MRKNLVLSTPNLLPLWFKRSTLMVVAALVLVSVTFIPVQAAVRVNTAKLMAAATQKSVPKYSPIAKNARIQGQVEVEIVVDEAGKVKSAKAISGPEVLREDARSAAASWRFDPSKLSDPNAEVIGVLSFTFKL